MIVQLKHCQIILVSFLLLWIHLLKGQNKDIRSGNQTWLAGKFTIIPLIEDFQLPRLIIRGHKYITAQ
jgi:hypothetical protein